MLLLTYKCSPVYFIPDYYRNNNEGGSGNYYQNGFQSGGYKRTGGNRGGPGGAPRQDRGGMVIFTLCK